MIYEEHYKNLSLWRRFLINLSGIDYATVSNSGVNLTNDRLLELGLERFSLSESSIHKITLLRHTFNTFNTKWIEEWFSSLKIVRIWKNYDRLTELVDSAKLNHVYLERRVENLEFERETPRNTVIKRMAHHLGIPESEIEYEPPAPVFTDEDNEPPQEAPPYVSEFEGLVNYSDSTASRNKNGQYNVANSLFSDSDPNNDLGKTPPKAVDSLL